MRSKPKRIYLQTGIEGKNYNTDDYNDLDKSSMTWCEDKVFESDLEFISVKFIRAKIDEIEKSIGDTKEGVNIINLLNSLLK